MARERSSMPQTRKTRIVCISDTHNQTPKLPQGDVLIHAGDLTNQGSYSELKKTVDWLSNTNFEAKIVIAGNHDITLDPAFYAENSSSWRWPEPQDTRLCRELLTNSPSITYLENQAATIYLASAGGPHTSFTVYGSPCTPKRWNWAFQYDGEDDAAASTLWDAIPTDTDIVVTHTPPRGHLDSSPAAKDDRSGCAALTRALHRVRPLISVCGHIHGGRGVERVRWNSRSCTPDVDAGDGSLVESVEYWEDPGKGNNKQSLVNLSRKGGRPLDNAGSMMGRITFAGGFASEVGGQAGEPRSGGADSAAFATAANVSASSGGAANSTSRPLLRPGLVGGGGAGGGAFVSNNEATCRQVLGGAIEYRRHRSDETAGNANADCIGGSDIGFSTLKGFDVDGLERTAGDRRETAMINAAYMGPHQGAGPRCYNKPIVVDIDLPVWRES